MGWQTSSRLAYLSTGSSIWSLLIQTSPSNICIQGHLPNTINSLRFYYFSCQLGQVSLQCGMVASSQDVENFFLPLPIPAPQFSCFIFIPLAIFSLAPGTLARSKYVYTAAIVIYCCKTWKFNDWSEAQWNLVVVVLIQSVSVIQGLFEKKSVSLAHECTLVNLRVENLN